MTIERLKKSLVFVALKQHINNNGVKFGNTMAQVELMKQKIKEK